MGFDNKMCIVIRKDLKLSPGKTAVHLKARGIKAPTIFPSRHDWHQWLA